MEKGREEREFDVEDRFATTIADDLRQLPLKSKLLPTNEIRNTLHKRQMETFNQRDHVANVPLNAAAQCSGYIELVKSISSAMTYINQIVRERNCQIL